MYFRFYVSKSEELSDGQRQKFIAGYLKYSHQ